MAVCALLVTDVLLLRAEAAERLAAVTGEDEQRWTRQLHEAGFLVIPDALDRDLLARLRHRFRKSEESELPAELYAKTGAFLPMDLADELTVEVLTSPRTWQMVRQLGWSKPKLHSFYISTKQPGAEALPWHCDVYYPWPGPTPPELFLLVYLHDTSPTNGCLRVVPGSHRAADAFHSARHTHGLASAGTRPDEVDVAVHAGDLIIADRRLLHATHANQTDQWRTCLTIAFAPAFDDLPDTVKARLINNPCLPRPGWWTTGNVDPRLQSLLPQYEGDAEPVPIT